MNHPQLNNRHPARQLFGIEVVNYGPGHMLASQGAPGRLLDADGCLPASALCVVADTVLGYSCATMAHEAQRIVTSQLTLDFAAVPEAGMGPVQASGALVSSDDAWGLPEGRLCAPDGSLIAIINARFAYVPAGGTAAAHVAPATSSGPTAVPAPVAAPPHPLLAGAPVYELLRARLIETASGAVELRVTVDPEFGNERGGLHGGIGGMIAERAADLALRTALPDGARGRLGNLRLTYIRPIAAAGETTVARAEVRHLGRTQALVRSELLTTGGKLAVAAEALFVVGPA